MDATVLIGTVIIAVTQMIKFMTPQVKGIVTILVSAGVGVIIALVDTHIGVPDITIAEGLMIGLGASGVVYTATRAGSKS